MNALRVDDCLDIEDILSEARIDWQPIFDMESGRMVGGEALFRGRLSPDFFFPLLDGPAKWEKFTRWQMEKVVDGLTRNPPDGPFLAFVNISPEQFPHALAGDWLRRLPEYVTPVIEILEKELFESHLQTISDLKRNGCMIAVDDFGTGRSNIDRLLTVEADVVKIDRTLIHVATDEHKDLVRGIIGGMVGRGITILGEGIETALHAAFASEIGCSLGQGWLLGYEATLSGDFYRKRFVPEMPDRTSSFDLG